MSVAVFGNIHDCFGWAHEADRHGKPLGLCASLLLGVLYIDEVQDSGRTILFATDPLNNMTVSFKVVETDDQAHMNLF